MSTALAVLDRPESPDGQPVEGGVGNRRLQRALFVSLVLFDVVVPAVHAWRLHLTIPTLHLDGAFQTASGLLRLSAGDLPGRDYFPYLGIGPVFLLYPMFLLLGGDMAASVFAAHFLTMLAVSTVVGTLAVLVTARRSKWLFAFAAAVPPVALTVVGSWPVATYVDPQCGYCVSQIVNATDPGLSLRPIRALAPYLLVLLVLLAFVRLRRTRTRMLVIGGGAGTVAALWSNDYGPVSGVLLLAVATLLIVLRKFGGAGRVRAALMLWGAAVGGYFITGLAATGGHLLGYLTYNFSDVRGDQAWYFGGWDPQFHVYSVHDLARVMLDEQAGWSAAVLVVAVAVAVWRRRITHLLVAYLGATTLLGALLATVGGHVSGYFWAFRLWGTLVTAIVVLHLVARVATRYWSERGSGRGRVGPLLRRATAAVVVVALAAVAGDAVTQLAVRSSQLASSAQYSWNSRLGGYLDVRYAHHVALGARYGNDVLEEYMGLLGAADGPNPRLRVDSVITALGEQRAAFAAELASHPRLVVSSAPGGAQQVGHWSEEWVTWAVSANWWFYRELFRAYRPEQTSPMTVAWTPAPQPAVWQPVDCRVSGYGVSIDAAAEGLYEVKLQYKGPGRYSRAFSMVLNQINAPTGVKGYVALDPGASSQAFPVYVHDPHAGGTKLSMKDVGAARGTRLTSELGCTASAITFPVGAETMDVYGGMLRGNVVLPYSATPADVTSGDYRHGIAVHKAALFVPNSVKNVNAFGGAHRIRFANGDTRTVEKLEITTNQRFIKISLSGAALDPDVAAYGHPFWLSP